MQDGEENYARYPSLEGRAVLITGGATGIGESLVKHFARQGARVAFFDVQDEPARVLVETLAAEGCPKPLSLHCDLTDVAALKEGQRLFPLVASGQKTAEGEKAARRDQHLV